MTSQAFLQPLSTIEFTLVVASQGKGIEQEKVLSLMPFTRQGFQLSLLKSQESKDGGF